MLTQQSPETPKLRRRLPNQRWQIFPEKTEIVQNLVEAMNISPIIAQLLINRGIETPEQAQSFLQPESLALPSPLEEFPDLAMSLELLQNAIAFQTKIAICGDYDADGMTSTALLLRALRALGAQVDYAIPSRMSEGYGINKRIIEEFHSEGVGLILTVDNGISAYEPIVRARELGLKVIITDHHDIPQKLPPANAILNPKLLPETSLYWGVAGVGVAYILAVSLSEQLGDDTKNIVKPILELFTLGTIADLAPLIGVNRRWLKRGLRLLPKSTLPGVQALIQVSGVQARSEQVEGKEGQNAINKDTVNKDIVNKDIVNKDIVNKDAINRVSTNNNAKTLKPEDIGFRLGPRINAIGRIGDPQTVIELLTTDDMGVALEKAMQCEMTNSRRQQLCEQIEQEAIAWVEESQINLQRERVLVVVRPNWHHGVIGIVASRLVERYGVPVFIGTYEDEVKHVATDITDELSVNPEKLSATQPTMPNIRGSARSIPEFNVFQALEYCHDLLGKFGGHKAAGGFSLEAENLESLRGRLREFANQCLEVQHLKPLLKIDVQANLNQINQNFFEELNTLHPCGIENPDPVFWAPNVQVIEQQIVGKGHIKLTLAQTIDGQRYTIKAIAWRWQEFFPLPSKIDIAYKLRENYFNSKTTIELELSGVRLPTHPLFLATYTAPLKATFEHNRRLYDCGIYQNGSSPELRIKNSDDKILAIQPGNTIGILGTNRRDSEEVDICQPPYENIIQAAIEALAVLDAEW